MERKEIYPQITAAKYIDQSCAYVFHKFKILKIIAEGRNVVAIFSKKIISKNYFPKVIDKWKYLFNIKIEVVQYKKKI